VVSIDYLSFELIGGDSGEGEHIFRKESERHSGCTRTPSERGDVGIPIVQEVFGFVKGNLSRAKRRRNGCREDGGVGQGAAVWPAVEK
jgi:hypothetical protein